MNPIIAIAKQTIRSAVRSRVFHLLFVLILLAVIVLPATVKGDGTAKSQLQISLTYSLGVVTVLIAGSTLWLGCALLSREIEAYNLHLVLTKPTAPWKVWLGKWLGVFGMEVVLLVFAAAIIYGATLFRLNRGDFPAREMEEVRNELLVGRRTFHPVRPDLRKMTMDEYERLKRTGGIEPDHDRKEILEQIWQEVRAGETEVPPRHDLRTSTAAQRVSDKPNRKEWVFRNVRVSGPEDRLYMRYRFYVEGTSRSSQRNALGVWGFLDPGDAEGRYIIYPKEEMSGTFREIVLNPSIIAPDGTVTIGFINDDPGGESIIFQEGDGPVLLARVVGFAGNYVRAGFMSVMLIAFLTSLGCMAGAAFSSPVAIFVGVAYLAIGMTVTAAVNAPEADSMGGYTYKNKLAAAMHLLALGIDKVVISTDDLGSTRELARGELVEFSRLAKGLLALIMLRAGPLAALGIWAVTRREMGTVVRK